MSKTFIKIKIKSDAKIAKCMELIEQLRRMGIVEEVDIDICFKPEDAAVQMSMAKGDGRLYEIDRTLRTSS
jgi:hypothetical protein